MLVPHDGASWYVKESQGMKTQPSVLFRKEPERQSWQALEVEGNGTTVCSIIGDKNPLLLNNKDQALLAKQATHVTALASRAVTMRL